MYGSRRRGLNVAARVYADVSVAAGIAGFDDLVEQATGHAPYAYQRRLAHDGLPELLRVPTGTGKTLAATLPWLYRRRFHPDPAVRASTPHWLVYALPMRVLVEQTVTAIKGWLGGLGLDEEIAVHQVMGGEGRQESLWRSHPEDDGISWARSTCCCRES